MSRKEFKVPRTFPREAVPSCTYIYKPLLEKKIRIVKFINCMDTSQQSKIVPKKTKPQTAHEIVKWLADYVNSRGRKKIWGLRSPLPEGSHQWRDLPGSSHTQSGSIRAPAVQLSGQSNQGGTFPPPAWCWPLLSVETGCTAGSHF